MYSSETPTPHPQVLVRKCESGNGSRDATDESLGSSRIQHGSIRSENGR